MSTQRTNKIHQIFLLTIWQEDDQQEEEASWRFLVEDPRSGRRWGGAGVAALVEGLLERVVTRTQPSASTDD